MVRMLSFMGSPSIGIFVIVSLVILLQVWQSHSRVGILRDPSLEVSIGGRQSQLQTGTYKRKLKDTGPLYSTHNCVGTSLRGGADQENTRCHFKNVCLSLLAEVYSPDPSIRESSVNLTYYRPPSAKEAPYYWNSEFDAASWVKVGRSSDVFPNVVYEAIGEEKSWSEAETTVLTEAFWPENFGHALGDDFLPVFRLAKSFSMWNSSEVQVIFHPGCDKKGEPKRGCGHHDEISSVLLTRRVDLDSSPFWSSGKEQDDANGEEGNGKDDAGNEKTKVQQEICFKNLLVGTRNFGMENPSEDAWPEFVQEIKIAALGVAKRVPLTKQKVLVFVKKGRRTLLNYEEMKIYLETRFDVDVELWQPSEYTLLEQIQKLEEVTLVVSPPGGISFSAMFLPRGSSAIFVDFWDTRLKKSIPMERRIYTYQSNITPYYYPVKFEDVVIDEAQVPQDILDSVSKHWLISRDYGDVMINLTRMENYVLAGLIQAGVSHGLINSFRQ